MGTLYLVRHADAADPGGWRGNDSERPLTAAGRRQAAALATAIAREAQPALVTTSPWLRAVETATPIAATTGLTPQPDERLGYGGPDLAGWIVDVVAAANAADVVAVSHGDLIPDFLVGAGLLPSYPALRTGSFYRVPVDARGLGRPEYVDRDTLDQGRQGGDR
jgi:broad specificity phosphatase PhoE